MKDKKRSIWMIVLIAVLIGTGIFCIWKYMTAGDNMEERLVITPIPSSEASASPSPTEIIPLPTVNVDIPIITETLTPTPIPYVSSINPDATLIEGSIDVTPSVGDAMIGDRGYSDDIILTEEMPWQEKAKFFNEIKDIVFKVAEEYNTNGYVLLALAEENSAHGQLKTVEYNNLYRITSDVYGVNLSLVYQDATGTVVVDEGNFKTYATKEESIRDMASVMVSLNITSETSDYEAFQLISRETKLLSQHYIDYMMTQAGQYRQQFGEDDYYDSQINYLDDWGITDKLKEYGITIGD